MNNRTVTHKDARPRQRGVRGKSGGAFGSCDERKRFFFDTAVQKETRRQVEAGVCVCVCVCVWCTRTVDITGVFPVYLN